MKSPGAPRGIQRLQARPLLRGGYRAAEINLGADPLCAAAIRVMIIGRPSEYAEERAEQLCSRIAEGERLRSICSAEDMPDKDIPPLSTDRRTSFIRNPSTTLVGGSAPRSAGDNGDIRLFFT